MVGCDFWGYHTICKCKFTNFLWYGKIFVLLQFKIIVMKDLNPYNVFSLPNGLRCVHRLTDAPVNYIGLAVNAGSRDDGAATAGLAHFVEHTLFKGTDHRSSWHISNRMEAIGGELNAYTSKEETVLYTIAPAGSAARALDLLADIVGFSRFPAQELEKERDVVTEEIYSYRDSPSDAVYDSFDELLYANSEVGHNILGSPESVAMLNGADCRGFIDRFYVPGNMVLYVASPEPAAKIERAVERYFGFMNHPMPVHDRHIPPMNPAFFETRDRDGHQAHTIYGARLFGRNDPRRFPLFLLNNYLGGPCMNSRLNQELREKRGLVYTVDSSVALLSDCGAWLAYFGSDKEQVEECIKLIRRELDNAAQSPMKPRLFEKIKNQYAGQLLVSSDNREAISMSMGKSVLYYGEVHDTRWTSERVREVTAEEVRSVAELLAANLCSRLTLC